MTFLKNFWMALEGFLDAYGASFVMMVLAGFIIAFITELGVKEAFKWLEKKLGDEKTWLTTARIAAIFLVTMSGCAGSTAIIMRSGLALPGNGAFAPFWFFIIYIAQYVFSMYGIKAILNIKDKEPQEKQPKPKKVSPVEGMTKIARNVYRDAEGNLFDKKGERI